MKLIKWIVGQELTEEVNFIGQQHVQRTFHSSHINLNHQEQSRLYCHLVKQKTQMYNCMMSIQAGKDQIKCFISEKNGRKPAF